ncbi:MAG: AMP-binding protein [Pseudomonadota bacterium]|nr:AMP-binding protein [Pseudomonadota bacterium]
MANVQGALPDLSVYDTGPKLLLWNAEIRSDRPAMREKYLGIWQTWTWGEVSDEVRGVAMGLMQLGVKRGDRVAIIGDNRPRLYWSVYAVQALGGVPVPIYQDAVAEEMHYVLENAEVKFIIAENQEQVDKVIEIKDRCPLVESVVYDDPRGLRNYQVSYLHDYAGLLVDGRKYADQHRGTYETEVEAGRGSDTSIMLYTSGTTGRPKGVVLSYSNILISSLNAVKFEGLNEEDEILAYLPMAWVGDHIFSYGEALCAGFCVACPESADTVLNDVFETGPTFFFAPPRIFENLLTSVMIRIEDAGWIKRKLFNYFMELAKEWGTKIIDGKSVPISKRLLYALGNVLIYGPLKNTLGLSRVRIGYTAGEAIGPDIFNFYRGIGLNLKQLYGMTEASVFVTIQPDGEIKSDTVGKPAYDVEIKIAENGEVLFKSPGLFREYYKNPEATAETKTKDGWCHTGDAGFFDSDGHLKIIDRAKDVSKLNDGTMFAPKYIENKLKFFSDIFEAVTFGAERDYVTAFVNIDLEAVGNWAERNAVGYASYQELAGLPQVYDFIEGHIRQVNEDLMGDPNLSGSQIKRFLVLHKQLDADDGELTRTQKVRRGHIAEKYAPLIDALYSGQEECSIETEVTFEDGRKGSISANLTIRDVEAATASVAKAAE